MQLVALFNVLIASSLLAAAAPLDARQSNPLGGLLGGLSGGNGGSGPLNVDTSNIHLLGDGTHNVQPLQLDTSGVHVTNGEAPVTAEKNSAGAGGLGGLGGLDGLTGILGILGGLTGSH